VPSPKKTAAKSKKVSDDGLNLTTPVLEEHAASAEIIATLKICSARGLRQADALGGSDPFVRCSINGSKRDSFTTPVIYNELNPVWNCAADVGGLTLNDILYFEVFDKDIRSEDSLGKCEVAVRSLMKDFTGDWKAELKLKETGKAGKVATADSHLTLEVSKVETKQGLKPHHIKVLNTPPDNGLKVMVNIIGARNLRNADFVGKSDPFCVCKIPNKPDSVIQTPMIKDTLNPQWNYTAQLANFGIGDVMNFTVFDEDTVGSDLLGRCVVKYDEVMPKGCKITKKLLDTGKIARDAEIDFHITVSKK